MLKSRYVLSQEKCCEAVNNFAIHEQPDDGPNEQESGFSELNFVPQDNVGRFQEDEVAPFCCSCKRITKLSLELYGQRLSLAETFTNALCFSHVCSGELVVYSHNRVILGKVKKTCSAWCSSSVLLIEDESQQEVYRIRMRCCQAANWLPRVLNCGQDVVYEAVNAQGGVAATITNVHRNCRTSLFTLQDDFSVHFQAVEKEKEKILLLNAVVYLNLMRHEWF